LKAQIASTAKELETAENAIKQRAAEDAKKNDPRLVEVGVSFHQGDEVLQMFTQNPLLRLDGTKARVFISYSRREMGF
jgi:hypothetical protein